jgi:hypothetical protein
VVWFFGALGGWADGQYETGSPFGAIGGMVGVLASNIIPPQEFEVIVDSPQPPRAESAAAMAN